jgi:Zn-dependent peptidase ImmA (M78 family)
LYHICKKNGKVFLPERYVNWEKNAQNIPLGKLKEISRQYKRQLAIFFLPDTPPKLKVPKDFRNIKFRRKGLSKELRLAIRRCYKFLDLARDIQGEDYWSSRYSWVKEVENTTKARKTIFSIDLINWLREKLKIEVDTQRKFKKPRDAFKTWRKSVEQELGIFIFQFPMPMDEIQGFCLTENPPYAVVVNNRHADAGKIFTIFHELAHIFKHESGICWPDLSSDRKDVEYEYNKFAAKFLVPDGNVFPISSIKELKKYANQLKISSEVYLRRNFELNLISKKKFFDLLAELKKQPFKKPKPGYVDPLLKSQSTRGEMFYNLLMSSVHNNRVDYNTVSDALGLTFKYLTNA